MKLWAIIIIIILLIAIAGTIWYLQNTQQNSQPIIRITSPTGNESWRSGEEHVISWDSNNIPANYKVSISIRRIPPPALQEEGQEFDPIIFTDLPNIGKVTWNISPMYPNGTYVLGIQAYESIPVSNAILAESAKFIITHPEMLNDVYPLYPDVDWQSTVVENFVIGTTTYSSVSISSQLIFTGMNPGSIFTAFERYYDKKLKALGWQIANDLAAGGHVGGQTGYRKGNNVILTRFQINYQTKPENAPTECPCDVTLSLFSTTPNF